VRRMKVHIEINGIVHEAEIEVRLLLADFIRDVAGLKGTHLGCEHGVCGTCTVQLDEEPVRSCSTLAVQAHRRRIRTVEALGEAYEDGLHPLQRAFHSEHALQCGFCTGGFLMTLEAFIRDAEDEDLADPNRIRQALSGNLCRCTGYEPIVAAVQRAARVLRA
jgi:aerobic-type carbon monoxide dehydrogenase small subunit (CoxS/CutS family)